MADRTITARDRRRFADTYGHRPRCNWGDGDLPAPWAEGDLVDVTDACPALHSDPPRIPHSRDRFAEPPHTGLWVVANVWSIDEGDAWMVRLARGGYATDRLHIAYQARCVSWDAGDVDWMAGVVLVDSADPVGLVVRERMLADGWTLP